MKEISELISLLESAKRSPKSDVSSVSMKQIDSIRCRLEISMEDVCEKLTEYNCLVSNQEPSLEWNFACHHFYILLELKSRLEGSKENQVAVSSKESQQIENGILVAIDYGLKPAVKSAKEDQILSGVKILMNVMSIRQFFTMHPYNEFKTILISILEAIFTLKTCLPEIRIQESKIDEILLETTKLLSPPEYFKIVFFIKGKRDHSNAFQTVVHLHLLHCLVSPGGFASICEVLMPSASGSNITDDKLPPSWQSCEIISKIIAHKGHKMTFYSSMIDEISRFLINSRKSESVNPFYKIAAVRCLRNLNELPYKEVREKIRQKVLGAYDTLAQPTDLLKGVILFDEEEYLNLIEVTHTVFCTSGPSDTTLPSKLIVPYLPIFHQLYSQFKSENQANVSSKLGALIVKCLSNRESSELRDLVECILYQRHSNGMKPLHPRVVVCTKTAGVNKISFSLQIGGMENDDGDERLPDYDPSATLVKILKESNHNILIYDVFLHLLEMYTQSPKASSVSSNNDLIAEFEDLTIAIDRNFRKNYAIINSLNELIAHKPFHNQFSENPQKLVELFEKILRDRMDLSKNASDQQKDDEILLIILSLLQEFLHKISNHDQDIIKRLNRTLREFQSSLQTDPTDLVRRKVDLILEPPSSKRMDCSPFTVAKCILVESNEPHMKVYGMMEMIKVLSSKDAEALTNSHAILAIAIKMLKDSDSYVFLNCIKLLIALMNVIDDTVLDALVSEYHHEEVDSVNDIDFRLKVGETIVKITEGLGPMSYKYKGVLINCFIRGGSHPQKEFRTSNLSNLGTICRILSYQVHQFFQELLILIENVIENDKYLPARRAATLILANILTGIDKLEDFQEGLLPIYRLLNRLVENDDDRNIRIHAQNGLDQLKEKVKAFLMPERRMEKEIKIFGVKDDLAGNSSKRKRGHILEIL